MVSRISTSKGYEEHLNQGSGEEGSLKAATLELNRREGGRWMKQGGGASQKKGGAWGKAQNHSSTRHSGSLTVSCVAGGRAIYGKGWGGEERSRGWGVEGLAW